MSGRPNEYKDEYVVKAAEYLLANKDTEEVISTGLKLRVKLPTIEGFAVFIDVNKTSLYEWEKQHPLFSNALDKIRIEQKRRLLNKGLSGDYNSTIAKLILSSNHGMRERSEVEQNLKGEAKINIVRPDGNKT